MFEWDCAAGKDLSKIASDDGDAPSLRSCNPLAVEVRRLKAVRSNRFRRGHFEAALKLQRSTARADARRNSARRLRSPRQNRSCRQEIQWPSPPAAWTTPPLPRRLSDFRARVQSAPRHFLPQFAASSDRSGFARKETRI